MFIKSRPCFPDGFVAGEADRLGVVEDAEGARLVGDDDFERLDVSVGAKKSAHLGSAKVHGERLAAAVELVIRRVVAGTKINEIAVAAFVRRFGAAEKANTDHFLFIFKI